jgi:hypothetical protein
MMKPARHQRERPVDVATEPIDRDLKACILTNLWAHPGSRVVKRGGHLFFQSGRFEILCSRLCEIKRRWIELVEHADLTHEDKWKIFALVIHGDGRLEQVPGGLKVTLPPRPRH